MPAELIQRHLAAQAHGDTWLVDVVAAAGAGDPSLQLYFVGSVDPAQITLPDGAMVVAHNSVGGADIVTVSGAEAGEVKVAGQPIPHQPNVPEHALLSGRNAICAVRNGETAEVVLDWIEYHTTYHGMTGAVILDRARPQSDPSFAATLRAGLALLDRDCRVILLDGDVPLGRQNLPPEAHPFCVPGAPGKDRMLIPPPDPWRSPLAAMNWYELARVRFLGDARAVANLDVHDLLVSDGDNVFDKAQTAEGGLVALIGRHCYPWRVRDGQGSRFGDHICVQFDTHVGRKRWCIAPAKAAENATWRFLRIGNAKAAAEAHAAFDRHMALRHPTDSVARIVPKSALIEDADLLQRAQEVFSHAPVRVPEMRLQQVPKGRGRRAIVTTMKNEGPFILEWIAYHRAIGFDDILVYTNDCTDGTDRMLDLLMQKGIVIHRDNRFREMGLKPQHAALQMAEDEPVIRDAKWVTCIDVDEYINIKTGDGTLDALFDAVPDANLISMTWRLFGNADIADFKDEPVTGQFRLCATEQTRKPHQAWGFKTLFQNNGIFRKLGVHRPKGLNPQLWEEIHWVNGSGKPLPRTMFRNAWRSTNDTFGYDLVQLNHYAVRSAESFLVKRDRGRVNHVDRDQGLGYWFRMNFNLEHDDSIQRNLSLMQDELTRLMADSEIAQAHADAVTAHRAKIAELRQTPAYAAFFERLTSDKMQRLSRLHGHFGANVYLAGPDAVPDEILERDPQDAWFFTVPVPGKTRH